MTITLNDQIHLPLKLDLTGLTPDVLFDREPDYIHETSGLSARILFSDNVWLANFYDYETELRMLWISMHWTEGPGRISAKLINMPEDRDNGDSLNDSWRLDIGCSRNLKIIESSCGGYCGEWQRTCPGPTHLLWLVHPAHDGPLVRLKDVGVNEHGGLKFRFQNYGYILFRMDPAALLGRKSLLQDHKDADYVILRYIRQELDTIWEIAPTFISRQG